MGLVTGRESDGRLLLLMVHTGGGRRTQGLGAAAALRVLAQRLLKRGVLQVRVIIRETPDQAILGDVRRAH